MIGERGDGLDSTAWIGGWIAQADEQGRPGPPSASKDRSR